jgi:tripartite-type tricarboxylate transporter receptor subunit TctC
METAMPILLRMKTVLCGAVLVLTGLLVNGAHALDFPDKPVTIVVPFGPGGATDTYGRYMAEILSRQWGQTVLVENRPGAGSVVGAAHVAKSKPDGYTLLWASTSTATALATQADPGFDPAEALIPAVMAMQGDVFVVTGTRTPMKSLAELKAAGEKSTLFSGSPGVGSMTQFANLIMNEQLGITTQFVQFTSGANLMTDMGGGRIDTHYSALLEAKAYDFATPIAVMSPQRSPALPNVPTTAEQGYPGAIFDLWWGLLAPAGTPDDVIARIRETTLKALKEDGKAAAFFESAGTRPNAMTTAEFTTLYKDSLATFIDFAKRKGIRK